MCVVLSSFMDLLETVKKPGLLRENLFGLEMFSPEMFQLLAFLHGVMVLDSIPRALRRRSVTGYGPSAALSLVTLKPGEKILLHPKIILSSS